jgi:diguanylate cyclase (GGDEF)-like protein
MSAWSGPNGRKAKSTSELARDARDHLAQLHEAVLEAEHRVVVTYAAELMEANEQLVVSTLRAQINAETVTQELKSVSQLAALDALTGLPKRTVLRERLGQAILHARRNHTLLALLFLDLDNFKLVNDSLGHATGDQALQQVAHCLVSAMRAGDTVSRHGGDEFLILLPSVTHASDAELVANKVLATLSSAGHLGDHVVDLTASIGISVYPAHGEDADTLIDRADTAMYFAKKHHLGMFAYQTFA